MHIWTYNLGIWEKENHYLKDWDDTMPEFKDFLSANDFDIDRSFEWGKESAEGRIIFFNSNDANSWLADIPTENSSFNFLIPDHPSFLIFKKEYKHLYDEKINDFVEINNSQWFRRTSIDQIYIKKFDNEEQLVFLDQKQEMLTHIFFANYEIGNGKKIGGRAREWLKENFVAE